MTRDSKLILIISGIVLVTAFIIWLIFATVESFKTEVTVNTSPKQVTIAINDQQPIDIESGYNFSVHGEEVVIKVSRDGFRDFTLTHTLTEDDEGNILNIALEPATFEAEQLLDTDEEADHRESIVTDAYLNLLDTMDDQYPILSELPHYGRYSTISQGVSQKNPNDETSFALYVDVLDAFEEEGRQEALKFLRDKGYKDDEFEVIFRLEEYVTRDQE